MKSTVFIIIIAASIAVISCTNERTQERAVNDVATKTTTEGKRKTITTQEVPDTIQYTFKQKYPKAISPVWVEYTPVETDELPMDNSYYYATFQDQGMDVTTWYNKMGDWVKTSTRIPGDSRLPDAVNKTLNEQYPGYKIDEINKENDKNMDMYEIKLKKGEEKAKLKVLQNGEVFKRKEK